MTGYLKKTTKNNPKNRTKQTPKEKSKTNPPNFHTSTTMRNHKTPYIKFPKLVKKTQNTSQHTFGYAKSMLIEQRTNFK